MMRSRRFLEVQLGSDPQPSHSQLMPAYARLLVQIAIGSIGLAAFTLTLIVLGD